MISQKLKQTYLIVSLFSLTLFSISSVSFAQERPEVPLEYQSYFEHYADKRTLTQKILDYISIPSPKLGRSFALIAGISDYPRLASDSKELRPASQDVTNLTNYLINQELFDEVVVLRNEKVTLQSFVFFLQDYFPLRVRRFQNSRFLFAYSGHGINDGADGYILTSRAENMQDTGNSIKLSTLRTLIDEVVKSGHQTLVLLNACNSGAFLRQPFGGKEINLPLKPGAHAITSSGPNSLSWHDPMVGKGSLLFEKLFEGLSGYGDTYPPGRDGEPPGDGIITVHEIFNYLKNEVEGSTNQRQTPQLGDISSNLSEGGFFFLNRFRLVKSGLVSDWSPAKQISFGEKKNLILETGDYFYGKFKHEFEREASDEALKYLKQNIAEHLNVKFKNENIVNGEHIEGNALEILKSYDDEILKHAQTIKEFDGDEIEVIHSINKHAIQKIFDERILLIHNLRSNALEYEENRNLSNALKLYYYTIILIRSMPERILGGQMMGLEETISNKIKNLLSNVQISVSADKLTLSNEREISLTVNLFASSVSLIDLYFWDGVKQTPITGRDGKATVILSENAKLEKPEEIAIGIKYDFYEERNEIRSVGRLWPFVNKPKFNNERRIRLRKRPANETETRDITLIKGKDSPQLETIKSATKTFLEIIKHPEAEGIRRQYANDHYLHEKIVRTLEYNNPRLTHEDFSATVNKTGSGWEVRSLPVLAYYPSIGKYSYEYLVLDFSEEGTLVDVNFGISSILYDEVFKDGVDKRDWHSRQGVFKFLEKYRTAYLNRDIPTLETIFADSAIIIVGRVFKKQHSSSRVAYDRLIESQPTVEYLRLSKQLYLERLFSTFKRQNDIFLGFSNFRIVSKVNVHGVYGISLRQSYSSTTYSDEGYLFLLVDFVENSPQILVRAWQPSEWDRDDLIHISNYRVWK